MKINDIAFLLGISRSTISNIINGRSNKYSKSTIDRVNSIITPGFGNYFEDNICKPTFSQLCDYAILNSKNVSVCNIAFIGKSWHNYLNNKKGNANLSGLSTTKSSATDVFKDPRFPKLCNFVLTKSKKSELRFLAVELLNISLQLNRKIK